MRQLARESKLRIDSDIWVTALRKYLGVPFAHQGRNKHGLDCFGLLLAAGEDIGLDVSKVRNIAGYKGTPSSDLLTKSANDYLVSIPYNRLQRFSEPVIQGDIVVFHIDSRIAPRHLAVITDIPAVGLPYIIHADAAYTKNVSELQMHTTTWLRRVNSVWRLPELTEQ